MHNEARSRESPIARRPSSSSAKSSESLIVKPYRRYPQNSQPPYLYPPYRLTIARATKAADCPAANAFGGDGTGIGHDAIGETDNDLARHIKASRWASASLSADACSTTMAGVSNTLFELWQCNAADGTGTGSTRPRAARSELSGAGRTMTDEARGTTASSPSSRDRIPGRIIPTAWRPVNIHFSIYGTAFATRLVTQMYFPGDPLFPFDPIFNSVRDERARQRMIAHFEINRTDRVGARIPVRYRGARAGGHAI